MPEVFQRYIAAYRAVVADADHRQVLFKHEFVNELSRRQIVKGYQGFRDVADGERIPEYAFQAGNGGSIEGKAR